jgi:hypothetical protein
MLRAAAEKPDVICHSFCKHNKASETSDRRSFIETKIRVEASTNWKEKIIAYGLTRQTFGPFLEADRTVEIIRDLNFGRNTRGLLRCEDMLHSFSTWVTIT